VADEVAGLSGIGTSDDAGYRHGLARWYRGFGCHARADPARAGGRYSTRILPDPDAVLRLKETLATAIEALR
jgi:hypothetical protein